MVRTNLLYWNSEMPLGITVLLSVIAGALVVGMVGGMRMLRHARQDSNKIRADRKARSRALDRPHPPPAVALALDVPEMPCKNPCVESYGFRTRRHWSTDCDQLELDRSPTSPMSLASSTWI
ncbi:lipopolysaccharide assembly LapA domain-containing protein [Nocardia salmonicida]|uniref:LapA family protein n=1 Tax=Nocardia salmonicida TaxID=53431 RepID=UPI0036C39068